MGFLLSRFAALALFLCAFSMCGCYTQLIKSQDRVQVRYVTRELADSLNAVPESLRVLPDSIRVIRIGDTYNYYYSDPRYNYWLSPWESYRYHRYGYWNYYYNYPFWYDGYYSPSYYQRNNYYYENDSYRGSVGDGNNYSTQKKKKPRSRFVSGTEEHQITTPVPKNLTGNSDTAVKAPITAAPASLPAAQVEKPAVQTPATATEDEKKSQPDVKKTHEKKKKPKSRFGF